MDTAHANVAAVTNNKLKLQNIENLYVMDKKL